MICGRRLIVDGCVKLKIEPMEKPMSSSGRQQADDDDNDDDDSREN